MPEIDIEHPHSLGKQDCHAAVDKMVHALSTRFGLGDMAWTGDTLGFAGRGIEGRLTVGESNARVHIRLGPVLGPLRPMIEAEVRRQLREHLD